MPKKPVGKKKTGDPLIGAIVERRWQILDQLGAGGMGVVYRAERVGLGKQVAIKFLHQSVAESKAAVARFEREAKAISRLHHMHCISILDFGVYRRQPYIVMEFVQGRQLTELDMQTLTPSRAVAMLRQILLGLGHAHSRGVIHRDLKLSNVMVVEMTGTEDLVKILDFGLARISGVNEEMSLTEGLVAGTPSYMSPEQALGKKTDQRSDIYSAGVMLYVLATGKRPFVADGTTKLLQMQIHEPPPPPRKAAPQRRISEALERVILRALEKRPADRFQSAGEFVAALDETPEGQETLTPTVRRDRPARRRRWRLMGIAAAACVALGAAGALWARAYVLQLRAEAVAAYERWTASEPAEPPPVRAPAPTKRAPLPVVKVTPAPRAAHEPPSGELPDPPKPAPTMPAPGPSAPAPGPSAPAPTATQPAATATQPAPTGTQPMPTATQPAATATQPAPTQPAPRPTPLAAKPAPPEPHAEHAASPAAAPATRAPDPAPRPAVPPAARAHAAAARPSREEQTWRQQIDGLIADGKFNPAKNKLRDRIAVDKRDGWSHLRLGDLYADVFHFRGDAFREWDSALALAPGLAGDAAFRKSVCEAIDTRDHARAQEFLRTHFGADDTAALMLACVRAATEPARIEHAAQLIEAVAGAERPELGMAALRMLEVGKTCAQKKAAVETIGRLHYLRARSALVKLDRVRLAHPSHPPPAVACFGTSLADTIEQLK